MKIRNNYAAEMVLAWLEGLSIVGALGFLFYDWKTSAACFGVFLLAIPARNYVKYGQPYPGKAAKEAVSPRVAPTAPLKSAEPVVSPLSASQPRTTV
ncbi:MAG TPA: hypothetical protein VFQ72_00730 [Candidatus Paceibacterota bacterium]|nr:hypothetical protein [Candidatus Paceibacterota bacterium]